MRAALILFALLAAPATGQQALCDYTAEADAADIDGLELLMGDPLNSCEGYSVSFTDFVAAVETVITPGFDTVGSGTNTTAAMVVGAGSSLKVASTGTLDASGIDADGDGTREIEINSAAPQIRLNPSDGAYSVGVYDGVAGGTIVFDGTAAYVHSSSASTLDLTGNSAVYLNDGTEAAPQKRWVMNWADTEQLMGSDIELCWSGATNPVTSANRDACIRRSAASALTLDSDKAGGAADLTVTGDVTIGADVNLSSAGALARIGAASGALPTCEAATARALIFDQTGDLCACPPDGSDWYDVSDGLGNAGDCS